MTLLDFIKKKKRERKTVNVHGVIAAVVMVVHMVVFTTSYFQKLIYSPKWLFLISLSETWAFTAKICIAHTTEYIKLCSKPKPPNIQSPLNAQTWMFRFIQKETMYISYRTVKTNEEDFSLIGVPFKSMDLLWFTLDKEVTSSIPHFYINSDKWKNVTT